MRETLGVAEESEQQKGSLLGATLSDCSLFTENCELLLEVVFLTKTERWVAQTGEGLLLE
jgi:hypothetical protein